MAMRPAVLIVLGVTLCGATSSSAQTFTFNGGATARTVPTGRDFATTSIGDPWDFNQASDHVWPFANGWTANPTVSGGKLTGVVAGADVPIIQPQFEGILGAINFANRNGLTYPIDPAAYNRVSFKMRRNRVTPAGEFLNVFWWQAFQRVAGTFGAKFFPAAGFDGGSQRYVNQSLVGSQTAAASHIFKVDLDIASDANSKKWIDAIARGIQLTLAGAGAMTGATIELEWIRLTPRAGATVALQWQSMGGAVTLTASNGVDTVQIFPDNDTNQTTFADNGAFTWDYGFLPPGAWTITAAAGAVTRQVQLTVSAAPIIHLTDPDARGGRDFARSVIGDAWDLTNAEDVTRYGGMGQISNAAFTEAGFSGVTSGGDPFIQLLDDARGAPGVDASIYRHLSFVFQAIRDDLNAAQMRADGGVARVMWRRAGAPQQEMTTTQDIYTLDGTPTLYTFDMPTLTKFGCGDCADCHLEGSPAQCATGPAGTTLWTGLIGALRFDPLELDAPRPIRISDVRLAADDEPNSTGFFNIRWSATDSAADVPDADVATATVKLSWDTDKNPANGLTLIAQNLAASSGQFAWHMGGLTPNRYWIYAEITDTAGNTQSRYSTGPVRIAATLPLPTDANGDQIADPWATKYGITDAAADTDNDGFNNLTEYRNATNPLIPQVWNLSEGATGFFSERIAVVNPDTDTAEISIAFLREQGAPIVRDYSVGPFGRVTIPVNEVAGLSSTAVSAVVTATRGGVVVERTMLWDARTANNLYGAHTGKGIPAARTSWLLAEGEANFFETYILFANATGGPASVTATYLLEGGAPVVRTYDVPANARLTVRTNDIPGVQGRGFSTAITSTVPITVERAMYFGSTPQRLWSGGHAAAAIAAPATSWFVAEGRTGSFFDMYLLIANPNAATTATIRFLLPGGTVVTRAYALPAQSRTTIHVDSQAPALTDTDVSAEITAPLGIVVERAMYWPDPASSWYEAHNSAGVTTTGTMWVLADGEVGGPLGWNTYVLLANPNPTPTQVTLTFLRTAQAPITITRLVAASSRLTVDAGAVGLGSGERFGVIVDTGAGGVPIVVEHALYFNGPGGQFWGAGTNESGVRIR